MGSIGKPLRHIGEKELFLPTAAVTLYRTSARSPYHAKFRVPLHFSKLDLRDYLYHAYHIRALSVRSYVQQQRVQSGKPGQIRPAYRRWHRPKAHKFMTVEMERPFVWPESPDEEALKAWNAEEVQAAEKEQKQFQERLGNLKDTLVNEERRDRMREQAKALLEGKVKWKPVAEGNSGSLLAR